MDKENQTQPISWHQEHKTWIDEVGHWQHESDRLVALLYQLERALPEHSSMLNNHVTSIEQHEGYLQRYENGMLEFESMKKKQEYHSNLSQLHLKMNEEHERLKTMYADEMEKFRTLLNKLLCECDKRLSCECDKEI